MISAASLYAAIDLGSNSFHMLVVRKISGTVQTVARIRRKVRLAEGLDSACYLSHEAMTRGWSCLQLFSERLQNIPPSQRCIVATATLRLATNAVDFLNKAETILGCPINVISGEEEARLIYQGVIHTTGGSGQRLVVDIGGASTELINGYNTHINALFSLPAGCVTWQERYFSKRQLTSENFAHAEAAVKKIIRPIVSKLCAKAWESCAGASGTIQATQEIMAAQNMGKYITLEKLQQLKQQVIHCGTLNAIKIEGLAPERAEVFPSGLAILIAMFIELRLKNMILAGGALREGLIYSMLHLPVDKDNMDIQPC